MLNKIDAADEIDRLVSRLKKETEDNYQIIPVSSKTGENENVVKPTILKSILSR